MIPIPLSNVKTMVLGDLYPDVQLVAAFPRSIITNQAAEENSGQNGEFGG